MFRLLILPAIFLFSGGVMAQVTGYVAAMPVLNIRESPGTQSKVVGKIPYEEKITYTYEEPVQSINTDGFVGEWVKVTYKGTVGYVVSTYVLPFPLPGESAKNLKDYFNQISRPHGPSLILKNKTDSEFETTFTKQIFHNGMEYHEFTGYEYYSCAYFLPEFDIQKTYILLRLLPEFNTLISDKDPFYRKSTQMQTAESIKKIFVETDKQGETEWIRKIRIEREYGAFEFVEILYLDHQILVYTGGGV